MSGGSPRSWTFTDLEYHALWTETTGTPLPFPFYFTTATQDPGTYRREKAQALAAVRERLSGSFDPVLETLIAPDIRVVLNGSDYRDAEKPVSTVRMIGVRRESRGFVVTSKPGETFWRSGGFTVVECEALRLADEMVARMPEREAGGRPETELPRRVSDGDRAPGGPSVHDSFTDTPQQRGSAFLAAPTLCTGTAAVEQGFSIYGPRGIARFEFEWRDLIDDGRYIIRDSDPPVAVAADSAVFTTTLNSKIAQVVRVIKDERQRH
ncbi:ESX secretion-associated protein EspG [Nocardia carnea]|uniref:ESX secretion-associated protein EspG n=1 Tax=Nocardia carnea TaxID=37328 RepID=UPI002455B23F|nr:ESX secretion-associated protein EspG [Nocardia carnea]